MFCMKLQYKLLLITLFFFSNSYVTYDQFYAAVPTKINELELDKSGYAKTP